MPWLEPKRALHLAGGQTEGEKIAIRYYLDQGVLHPEDVNEGVLRDGVVHWSNGRRSFLAQERSGVVLGDIDGANRYRFRRS